MADIKPIGGFFELETPKTGTTFHVDALALTNGRACMSYILEKKKPSKVYLPYYTCDALFEPMHILGIPFEFYQIDFDLNPVNFPKLAKNELIVYINFYGLKNKEIKNLIKEFREQIIVDNTHNFFNKGYRDTISFTSARKYFGVPDGAYLYSNFDPEYDQIDRFEGVDISHNVKRLMGDYKSAYEEYLEYEESLNSDVKSISMLSEKLLQGIDYSLVAEKRMENFLFLHRFLEPYNCLKFSLEEMEAPFCYPFLPENYMDKKLFHAEKFFIPVLWPEVLKRRNSDKFSVEKEITEKLFPLPIDQRNNKSDMRRMAKFIMERLNK